MSVPSNFVSQHPYFKAHPGKLEAFKAGLPAFRKRTATEEKNLFYDFTVNGDEIFCREGCTGAEALLAHLDNVVGLLAEAFKIADLLDWRCTVQRLSSNKLRAPLAHAGVVRERRKLKADGENYEG